MGYTQTAYFGTDFDTDKPRQICLWVDDNSISIVDGAAPGPKEGIIMDRHSARRLAYRILAETE